MTAYYTVIRDFADLQDGNHVYKAGDPYPRMGYEPTETRIRELLEGHNRLGDKLIAKRQGRPRKAREAEPAAPRAMDEG